MKLFTLTRKSPEGLWKVCLMKEDEWGKRLAGTWTNLETFDAQAMVWNWETSGKISSKWPGHFDNGVYIQDSYSVNLDERINTCNHTGGKEYLHHGFVCFDCGEMMESGEDYSEIEKLVVEVEELLNA